MARKGLPVSGWVVVDKPAGIGSTAVVGRVRRAYGAAKAGHAGTLDPDATGVLAVALGEATKTIPCIAEAPKCYRFAVRWGAETASDDASGAVLRESGARPEADAIAAALPAFRGDILQVPPQVSAVRVEGARAYDLAREGVAMDLAARPLHVARLDLAEVPDADTAVFEMECGKGGYVRSIARDLGRALGCLGHALWLRRLWSGPFLAEGAARLEEMEPGGASLARHLRSLEVALAGLPECPATPEGAARLRHGNPGAVAAPPLPWDAPAWASEGGRALAIGRCRGGEFHPDRVLK